MGRGPINGCFLKLNTGVGEEGLIWSTTVAGILYVAT